MPPIDPNDLTDEQKRALQPQGLPTGGVPFGPITLRNRPPPPRDPLLNEQTGQNIQQSAGLFPSQLEKSQTDVEKARLELRKMRIEQGLDPDTGKPLAGPNAGKVGEDALAGLSEGEKNIVKGITIGKVPVTSFALARNPQLMKYLQIAYQYEPGTDLTTFQRRQAGFTKFLSQPNSPMVRVNQALQHLDRFYGNAHGLDNFGAGALGAVGNYARAGAMAATKDPRYQAFASDREALAAELAAAFQGSGQGGALADREHWKTVLTAAQSPEAFDKTIGEIANLLGGRAEASASQFQKSVGASADAIDLMSPEARKSFEKYTSPDFGGPSAATDSGEHTDVHGNLSTTYKRVPIPEGYQEDHAAFMKEHPRGTLTAEQYIEERHKLDQKYHDQLDGFTSTMSPEDVQTFVHEYNKGGAVTKIPALNVPMSAVHHMAAVAATSAPGVLAANAANAATIGAPELMFGQAGRDAFHEANQEHPIAAGIGDVVGSVMPIGGAEKGFIEAGKMLGKDLTSTARKRLGTDIAANMIYQGGRGFNDAGEGQGGTGLVEGLGAGAGGAVAGNLITKGISPVLKEGTADALKALKGIDLTTLQRLGLGPAETAASGVPFVHAATKKAVDSFNRVNGNRALQNIDPAIGVAKSVPKDVEAGTPMTDFVHQQLSDAYNAIKPKIVGSVDMAYGNAMTALKKQAQTSPEKKKDWKLIENEVAKFEGKTGDYDGNGYQAASEGLRALVKDFGARAEAGDSSARDMMKLADQARQQMRAQVGRNDPVTGKQLKGVEKGWAHLMRIEDATTRANGVGYSPDQYLATTKKLDTSGRKTLFARGKAFEQPFAQAGTRIMGSTPPRKVSLKDTGITIAMLAGAGYGAHAASPALGEILGGALAAGYVPLMKRGVQAILTKRPPSAAQIDAIKRVLGPHAEKLDNATRRSIEAAIGQKLQGNLPEEGH